ncbi:hypothetical protein [Streptomyces phytohabitans]|uniref:hypothetical protein n=1 Tax=Streptomyces phytohabitans TaxID=1150371 RepID=UPI00345BE913
MDAEPVPFVGAVYVDAGCGGRVGEFRGVVGPYWLLRPVGGGREWEADPGCVRVASVGERVGAWNARCNARSRGEVL